MRVALLVLWIPLQQQHLLLPHPQTHFPPTTPPPLQAPEKFVQPDPEMAATLLDQKEAGKMLLLITNR